MKKLILLAAMLAMTQVTIAPALAQDITQSVGGQKAESGDFSASFEVASGGNSSNQCTTANQSGNTGNLQNAQGVLHSNDSEAGDIEFGGGSISSSPKSSQECEQAVQQAAVASVAPKAVEKAPSKAEVKVPPKAPEAKVGEAVVKAEAPEAKSPVTKAEVKVPPKVEAPKAETKKAEEKKELPKTGGIDGASLFTLGVGSLLVAGGVLIRKLMP